MKCLGLEHTVDRLGEPIQKPVKRVTFSSLLYCVMPICRNCCFIANANSSGMLIEALYLIHSTIGVNKQAILTFYNNKQLRLLGKYATTDKHDDYRQLLIEVVLIRIIKQKMSVSSYGDEKDDKVSDLEEPSSPSPTPKVPQTTQEVKDDKQVDLHISGLL